MSYQNNNKAGKSAKSNNVQQVRRPFILQYIYDAIMLPFFTIKEINKYNAKVRKMAEIVRSAETEHKLMTLVSRNGMLSMVGVALPMIIGMAVTAAIMYSKSDILLQQGNYLRSDLKTIAVSFKVGDQDKMLKQCRGAIKFLAKKDRIRFAKVMVLWLIPLLIGYMLALVSSLILDGFEYKEKQSSLQKMFLRKRLLDDEENPWDAVWTPYAVMVYTYGVDNDVVSKMSGVFSVINFKPGPYYVDPQNSSTVVMVQAYTLPKTITIKVPKEP